MDTSLVSNSLNQVAFITFFRVSFCVEGPKPLQFFCVCFVIFFAMWLFPSSFLRKNKDESPQKGWKRISLRSYYVGMPFMHMKTWSTVPCSTSRSLFLRMSSPGRKIGVKFSYKYFNHKVMLASATQQHIIFVHTWRLSSCVLKDG